MREIDNLENRSDEVQEILGTPPHWLVSWGTLIAFVAFVLLAWLSFFVAYPDTVTGSIRVTFKEPPIRLTAGESNYIENVLVKNNEQVEDGKALLVFRNSANFRHVMYLHDQLLAMPNDDDTTLVNFGLDTVLILGDLQEDLYNFLEKRESYLQARSSEYEKSDIRTLSRQIETMERSIAYQKRAKERLAEQIDQASIQYKNDDYLVKLNREPVTTLNASKSRLDALEEEMQALEADIRDKQFEISSLRGRANLIHQGAREGLSMASGSMRDAFIKLKVRVENYIKKNILVAPFAGSVQIVGRNIGQDQFVQEGDELMVLMPNSRRDLIGRMLIKFEEAGMVKEGQRVVIQVSGYSAAEFGMVEGIVAWKSKAPRDEDGESVVPVEVEFPYGLVTNTGQQISAEEELFGKGRIVTAERRFIERVFGSPRSWKPDLN